MQALLLLKQGQPTDALRAGREGLRLDPNYVPLYRVVGSMLDAANDVEAAREIFAQGLRLQPSYAQIYHAWARLEGRC